MKDEEKLTKKSIEENDSDLLSCPVKSLDKDVLE